MNWDLVHGNIVSNCNAENCIQSLWIWYDYWIVTLYWLNSVLNYYTLLNCNQAFSCRGLILCSIVVLRWSVMLYWNVAIDYDVLFVFHRVYTVRLSMEQHCVLLLSYRTKLRHILATQCASVLTAHCVVHYTGFISRVFWSCSQRSSQSTVNQLHVSASMLARGPRSPFWPSQRARMGLLIEKGWNKCSAENPLHARVLYCMYTFI